MTGRIRTETVEGVTILGLEGALTEKTGVLLTTTLRAEVQAAYRKFVLDLSGVEYVDSMGVGYLTVALTTVSRRSGMFVLAAPTKKVEKVLEMLRLLEIFVIFDSVGSAIEAVKHWTYDDFMAKTRGAWKKGLT